MDDRECDHGDGASLLQTDGENDGNTGRTHDILSDNFRNDDGDGDGDGVGRWCELGTMLGSRGMGMVKEMEMEI